MIRTKEILRFFPTSQKAIFWLSVAFVIKAVLTLYFITDLSQHSKLEFWGTYLGDSRSYYLPAENLYQHGTYAFQSDANSQLIPYSGRMPGYAVIFLFFRLFLSFENTLNALVLLQIFIDAAACYALGLICEKLTKNKWAFIAGFSTYAVSTFVSLYDFTIMTESLGISFFVIGSYFLITSERKAYRMVLSGFFLVWMFFLRPYTFPVWLLGGLWLLNQSRTKVAILYFLPFLIADGTWVARNWHNEKKIIFAQSDIWASYDYPNSRVALFKWIQAWGGDVVWWNPKAEIGVFFRPANLQHLNYRYNSVADLPDYVYSSYYNADSLEDWRKKYNLIESEPQKYRNTPFESELVSRMNRFQSEYLKEHFWEHRIYANARLIKAFLFHSGTTNFSLKPYEQMNWGGKFLKISYSLMYMLIVPLGLIGTLVLFALLAKNKIKRLLFESVLFFILVNVGMMAVFIHFRFVEYRYLVIFYPSGIIIWVYGLLGLRKNV